MRADQGHREAMANVDTAWLRMDSAQNPMVINGVLIIDEPMTRHEFIALISARIVQRYRRFRQRPIKEGRQYFWQECADIDMGYHVPEMIAPERGAWSDAALKRACSDLVSEQLDFRRPLWRFYFMPNYNGGCAIFFRIHHSYGDGLALISVLDSLSDSSVLHSSPAAKFKFPKRQAKSKALWHRALFGAASLGFLSLFGAAWLYEASRVTFCRADSKTRYKRPLSARKNVSWAPSLPVTEVKDVAKSLGCSMNDVLLGCVAGSLRRNLIRHGETAEGVVLRATVPVNLRSLDQAAELGNHFGLVYLNLPIGEPTVEGRIKAVQKNMKSLKSGMQAIMTLHVIRALGYMPEVVERFAQRFFSSKASAVMTNVPGPSEPVRLNDKKVLKPMFWVPQSGGIGLGVSIFSYNNHVEFGFLADQALVENPQTLVDDFMAEFAEIRKKVLGDVEFLPQAYTELDQCEPVKLKAG